MANDSKSLTDARINKKDEFYTTYEDIEKELKYYKSFLSGKTILLPCDTTSSNFYIFLKEHFYDYNIKSIVSIYYGENVKKTIFNGEEQIYDTNETGDFRNSYTLDLIKECDVVITNPPFSLFKDFIKILIDNKKYFLIIGNINSITTNIVWKAFIDNKLWLGKSIHSGDRKFYVPNDYPLEANTCGMDTEGKRFIKVKGVRWFTNISYEGMNEGFLQLTEKYEINKYEKYDNYNAINVDETKKIPYNYNDLMGVPITFLDKYNQKQFEIVGMDKDLCGKRFLLNGKNMYARIVIKKRRV